jgi:hypothetical protein
MREVRMQRVVARVKKRKGVFAYFRLLRLNLRMALSLPRRRMERLSPRRRLSIATGRGERAYARPARRR